MMIHHTRRVGCKSVRRSLEHDVRVRWCGVGVGILEYVILIVRGAEVSRGAADSERARERGLSACTCTVSGVWGGAMECYEQAFREALLPGCPKSAYERTFGSLW